MKRSFLFLIILILFTVACKINNGPEAKNAGSSSSISTKETGDFVNDEIGNFVDQIPRKNTDAFVKPEDCDAGETSIRTTFKAIIEKIYKKEYDGLETAASRLNYDLIEYSDSENDDALYYLLIEKDEDQKHQGFFAINPNGKRNLVIEAPHPIYDIGTPTVAAYIFRETNAKALMIGGTHRCSNTEESECSGTTAVCGDSGAFRTSDFAHYTCSLFHAAHEALSVLDENLSFIQVHAFTQQENEADIVVSDGVNHITDSNSDLIALANNLIIEIDDIDVGSCQVSEDNGRLKKATRLCATLNVQARFTNNQPESCSQSATISSGRFIHLELDRDIINKNTDEVISAIKTTFDEIE